MTPTFPDLDRAILEALALVPEAALLARAERGSGLGLGHVCQAELDRRAAIREVSAVTDAAGATMIKTLQHLGNRNFLDSEATDLWRILEPTERLRIIRTFRAYETDPNFRVRVHILLTGHTLCGKPGIPGRWGDGDSWAAIGSGLGDCEICLSRVPEVM